MHEWYVFVEKRQFIQKINLLIQEMKSSSKKGIIFAAEI